MEFIIFVFITILMAAMVIIIVPGPLDRKENTARESYRSPRERSMSSDEVVANYNKHIKLFQKKNETVTELAAKIRDSLNRNADEETLCLLKKYTKTANHIIEDIEEYFANVRKYIEEDDPAGASIFLYAIEADEYLLDDVITNMKQINIEPETKECDRWFYFKGCETKEDMECRYRNLSKALHPDSKGGDKTAFQDMVNEYEKVKAFIL